MSFAYAPMPAAYGGKHIWFTLRFASPVPARGIPLPESYVWGGGRSEWVEASALAVGDYVPDYGDVIARVEIAGQPAWKFQVNPTYTQIVPFARLERVARLVQDDPRRARIEWDGAPSKFDASAFEALLAKLHAKHPLVAVFFQDGSSLGGESLEDLDDATLVERLANPPPPPPPRGKAARPAKPRRRS